MGKIPNRATTWEHFGIITSNHKLISIDYQAFAKCVSVQAWGFCRIELDENAIEYSPSLIVRTERDCLQHNSHIDVYNTKKWKFKDTYDWCTPNWENQHEERILSRVPFIDNAIQFIKRMGITTQLAQTENKKGWHLTKRVLY